MSLVATSVKFNVSGRMFEVSRSLLQFFPESLLAKLAQVQDGDVDSTSSDDTRTHSDDNDAIIFIDRDSDRFACILNYMRDGEVDLPSHISKRSLLKDFDYYGFDSIDTDSIGTCWSVPETCSILEHYKIKLKTTKEEISSEKNRLQTVTDRKIYNLEREKLKIDHTMRVLLENKESKCNQLEAKLMYTKLAYDCFFAYTKSFKFWAKIQPTKELDSTKRLVATNTELQESFREFGLEFVDLFPYSTSVTYCTFKFRANNEATTKVRLGKRSRND